VKLTRQQGGFRPGAGRKPKYGVKTKSITVTLPEDLVKTLDAEASDLGCSRSEVLVRRLTA
jgi:hypothetical protein